MPLVKTYNVKILKKINSADTTRRSRRHSIADIDANADGANKAQRMQTEQTTQAHEQQTSHKRRGRDIDKADADVDGAADGTAQQTQTQM